MADVQCDDCHCAENDFLPTLLSGPSDCVDNLMAEALVADSYCLLDNIPGNIFESQKMFYQLCWRFQAVQVINVIKIKPSSNVWTLMMEDVLADRDNFRWFAASLQVIAKRLHERIRMRKSMIIFVHM